MVTGVDFSKYYIKIAREEARKQNVEVEFIQGDMRKLPFRNKFDAGKVKEVVSNMIDNGLKYTPKGGVTLRVELTKNEELTTDNKEVVRVIVSDTGIGIPATELPYLFAKFSRGKDVGRLNVSGTGLGLYVGKAIVEANGGRIWAESDGEGKGSRFIIELPIKQSEELLQRWG